MNLKTIWTALCFLLIATPTFAADGSGTNWIAITSGFSMAIAAGLAALGQGRAVASAVEGMARNPGASGAIQGAMILGLVFMESLVLFTLLIVFVKVV